MVDYLTWEKGDNYASNLYNLKSGLHYNIPKQKFLYHVEFNVSSAGQKLTKEGDILRRLGFQVKSVDRPNTQYTNKEMNQYNKKTIITTGSIHGPCQIGFYDTIDDNLLKMVKDYNDFYYNDWQREKKYWNYADNRFRNNGNIFGVLPRNGANDMYFFDSVDVYEFYNGYYTKYCLMNPKIENANFTSLDVETSGGIESTMVLKPEGVVYEAISAKMTKEVSDILGLPFQEGSTENFIPREKKLVGSDLGIMPAQPLHTSPYDPNSGGSSIGDRILGRIASGVLGGVVEPLANKAIGNVMTGMGLGGLAPTAQSMVSSGIRGLQGKVSGGLF